ncbi:unnamed protein product [Cutaneotrichosporon oleaginosum]
MSRHPLHPSPHSQPLMPLPLNPHEGATHHLTSPSNLRLSMAPAPHYPKTSISQTIFCGQCNMRGCEHGSAEQLEH